MKQHYVFKATVRIIAEGLLDLCHHGLSWLCGNEVYMRLVSVQVDSVTGRPRRSSRVSLSLGGGKYEDDDSFLTLYFKVDEKFGKPGAIQIKSFRSNEFYLKSVTLDLPDNTQVFIPCYSWIVHVQFTSLKPRVFFSNQVYLPSQTPPGLVKFRERDLGLLQGDGKHQRKHGQRIYDYALYNDLSNPDVSKDLGRPVLGGSEEFPYPRRCRTGRKHTKTVPECERPKTDFDSAYVPRDERFSALKKRLFMTAGFKSLGRNVLTSMASLITREEKSFDAFEHIHSLFVEEDEEAEPSEESLTTTKTSDGTSFAFPRPGVIRVNKEAWRSDREFARQRLAGTNPLTIELLKVFPPVSTTLDEETYGNPVSSITYEHLEPHLEGVTVQEAMQQKRLFLLDYHDILMPYVNKINETKSKTYAPRVVFFMSKAQILLPVAIELTLPPKNKGEKANSRVFTPSDPRLATPDWPWQFAKTHVAVIDGGVHQLVSHWLRTHACVEPMIIATRRQLSAMHPLHVLLTPHFKDTLHINALARSSLICAGGKIESHFFSGRYSLEICSKAYKGWRFDEQALPKDLIKRGMAEEDPSAEHGVRLVFEDYPYAADGLELWGALSHWVKEYVALYYQDDEEVQKDVEVQAWWEEIRTVGHGDHSGATWWPAMASVAELADAITIIVWMASALHAAVNFGQYAYNGYMPNCPCMARRLIPEEGTHEYKEMMARPEKFFLEIVPTQGSTTLAMAVLEILAQHISEEEYLGERKDTKWTNDERALEAFGRFGERLKQVEAHIQERNAAADTLHHRAGPVSLPYTLLLPSSGGLSGLTFRGVPNSISI